MTEPGGRGSYVDARPTPRPPATSRFGRGLGWVLSEEFGGGLSVACNKGGAVTAAAHEVCVAATVVFVAVSLCRGGDRFALAGTKPPSPEPGTVAVRVE